jgi:aminopeptidase N
LRVLTYKIGETAFRDGIRQYLKEHAYANAEWKDLIGAFSKASGQDLNPWAAAWIQQRGMPEVTVHWTCDAENRIAQFEIAQSDTLGEGHTWPVETQVLLGYKNDPGTKVKVAFNTARAAVPGAVGKSCPDYVFGNDEDHGYGRFLLDDRSLAGVSADLEAVKDPLLRALLWGALWDSVRESNLAPLSYIELVVKSLSAETDLDLTQTLLTRMRTAYVSYLSDAQRKTAVASVESLLMDRVKHASSPDLRITYFRALVVAGSGPVALDELKMLLSGKESIAGVPLKQRDRWTMISALVRQSDPDALILLTAEAAKDKSDDGRKSAYAAQAGLATAEGKAKYFNDYLKNKEIPEDWITASLADFNAWNQPALTLPYLKPALDALPQMKRERKIFFVNGWLSSFVGGQKTPAALKTVDTFLADPSIDPDLRLKIVEVKDELERTVRIRTKYGS